jgi:hypothetical protein
MPKIEIDYSNTIIYKITCKDTSVNDVYVGHTTNFVQRKHAHKQSCINDKSPNHNCKLYEVIRNNGGWNNWKMEIINFFNCQDHYQARQKEHEYFVSLNATLNSIEPMPKPKIKPIEVKETNEAPSVFSCILCNYHCSVKFSYERHLLTAKHISQAQKKMSETNETKLKQLACDCGIVCYSRTTLWRHKKTCINTDKCPNNDYVNTVKITPSEQTDKDLIILLLKQNNELQNKVLEFCKILTNNIL